MAEININGEIVPFVYYWDESGFTNLTNVEKQLTAAKGEDIIVNINSIGGDVDEGFLIYSALRKYAKENNAKVTTYAKGRCYSIATVIFLAGDERILNRFLCPFVHNAWTYAEGDSKQLLRYAVDLEKVNERIAKFYEDHTDLTYQEARDLMENETSIEPQEALNIRFGTNIEEIMRPVALNKIFNKNKFDMSKEQLKDDKSLIRALKNLFAPTGAKNLEVFTSASETLLFPDLEEGDSPKVGDRATIDGRAAEGEVTLQDGTIYVFVAGILEEIKEADGDEDESETTERIETLEAENKALKDQLAAQNSKITALETKVGDFDKNWSNLKSLVSNHVIDDKENSEKSNPKKDDEPKKGLSGSIGNLKKKEVIN